jgi:hypothetical protein
MQGALQQGNTAKVQAVLVPHGYRGGIFIDVQEKVPLHIERKVSLGIGLEIHGKDGRNTIKHDPVWPWGPKVRLDEEIPQ